MLHTALDQPSSAALRVCLLHGFTLGGKTWQAAASNLVEVASVVAPDLPGHGLSPADHDVSDLWKAAELVGQVGGKGVYVGYSLGARVALHLALSRPELVEGLVLVGGRAGIEDEAERISRRARDHALAAELEALGDERLAEFVDEWLSQPFNAVLDPAMANSDVRLENRAHGLAASLRHCGLGSQESLWPRLPTLTMPVLIICGADDAALALESRRLVAAVGANAEMIEVPATGHAVPFEAPREFAQILTAFIARL